MSGTEQCVLGGIIDYYKTHICSLIWVKPIIIHGDFSGFPSNVLQLLFLIHQCNDRFTSY